MATSIPRNWPRFDRWPRNWAARSKRCGGGCARRNVMPANVPTDGRQRLKQVERENVELKRANEILVFLALLEDIVRQPLLVTAAGFVSAFGGFGWLCLRIRCPNCGVRIFW